MRPLISKTGDLPGESKVPCNDGAPSLLRTVRRTEDELILGICLISEVESDFGTKFESLCAVEPFRSVRRRFFGLSTSEGRPPDNQLCMKACPFLLVLAFALLAFEAMLTKL